jgi:hypothetical protein
MAVKAFLGIHIESSLGMLYLSQTYRQRVCYQRPRCHSWDNRSPPGALCVPFGPEMRVGNALGLSHTLDQLIVVVGERSARGVVHTHSNSVDRRTQTPQPEI